MKFFSAIRSFFVAKETPLQKTSPTISRRKRLSDEQWKDLYQRSVSNGLTLQQVAEEAGMTRERVRQVFKERFNDSYRDRDASLRRQATVRRRAEKIKSEKEAKRGDFVCSTCRNPFRGYRASRTGTRFVFCSKSCRELLWRARFRLFPDLREKHNRHVLSVQREAIDANRKIPWSAKPSQSKAMLGRRVEGSKAVEAERKVLELWSAAASRQNGDPK